MASNSGSSNPNDKLASLFKSMGGDDCDRPACDDTKSALSAALQRVGNKNRSAGGSNNTKDVVNNKSATDNITNAYKACPPTRDEIGASTWSLLHSMVRLFHHGVLHVSGNTHYAFSSAIHVLVIKHHILTKHFCFCYKKRHSFFCQAAWYPNKPTSEDKRLMSNFMSALARFYPCTWCATDFQKHIELSPPR